jgi:hypothetical protein
MIVNELLDRPHAQILWDYLQLNQPLVKADFLFVMCSYNLNIADHAHILFQQGMGEKIVLSGGPVQTEDILINDWDDPEAIVFKNRLVEIGMKAENIIVEDRAEDTTQNAQLTKELLAEELPEVSTGLIVHKPYMERRAFMTTCQEWPEIEWRVTSPIITYEKYIAQFDEARTINRLVREAHALKDVEDTKFQVIPEKYEVVENALNALIDKGYNEYVK